MKIEMKHARTTKNTYRYESEDPRLPVLYVHKLTWPGEEAPSAIMVEISNE
jgi:hypothetical protein